jgi:3-oxoacyl-[acyl-carrier-protein] synthase II
MKVTFVYPRFERFLSASAEVTGLVKSFLADFTTPPSLGIPIMAAWTPAEVEIELLDDNAGDPIDYAAKTDLVAINCFTPQATRAFEIADGFRRHGTQVIMGGLFPSFMVKECLEHADAVNVGEVEPTWEQILKDAAARQLKPKYIGGCRFDVAKLRIPRRDLFYAKTTYDWDEDLLQITRGCCYNCAMCAIPAHMGSQIRFRPIDQIVAEVKTLKFENVYLADDTLFFPQRRMVGYARELFAALAPLGKKYFVASTMALNTDDDFLDLAARVGVSNFYCTMNVDPLSIRALQGSPRERTMLCDLVRRLEDRQIRFFGSFALGRDWDDNSIAERILALCAEAGIRTAEFFLFTPYPGSVHWDRLERQGRIFDRTWSHYNGANVVAQHPTLSTDELYQQFITVWSEFFRRQKGRFSGHLEPLTYEAGKVVLGKPLRRQGVRLQAAVTGMGMLTPIGNSAAEVLASLRAGRHGLAPATSLDASCFTTDLVGEIRNFSPEAELTAQERADLDDAYLKYAVCAARRALADADLQPEDLRTDTALVLGTCNGGLRSGESLYRWKHGKAPEAFSERMNLQAQYYAFGKALAHALGIRGETWVVTTACSSTTVAIGLAHTLIRRGYAKRVLLGGADALCLANLAGFNALRALSDRRLAPFSLPAGLNIGEGACFWVVEEMESALLREAPCRARIAGHATSADAYHPTSPDPAGKGVAKTLTEAAADAGLPAASLGWVNAHGTGTLANDGAESRGIAAFSAGAPLPAVSLKSFFGHCMGSTGLIEATCGILAMNDGFIPPTLNLTQPRPGCDLDYVPNLPRPQAYDAFIKANYAFGGNNAAVVITRWDKAGASPEAQAARVAITGLGLVSALGAGLNPHLQALRQAGVGIGVVTEPIRAPGVRAERAGLVAAEVLKQGLRRTACGDMNKISQMATLAASLALAEAGLRIGRDNAGRTGVVLGACNGPPERRHMDAVLAGDSPGADIACFSNITANSTAGWVSHALQLRGVNATLSPGPHAGLQSLAYAFDAVCEGRSPCILAGAADEVYDQTFFNYDYIGYLNLGAEELDYRLRLDNSRRKTLGEGAAVLCLESLEAARARGAPVLGEILAYAMSMDGAPLHEPSLDPDGLKRAVQLALERAALGPADIDLCAWAPQGNTQDLKALQAWEALGGGSATPWIATSFNTGYIESASILVSLACLLGALRDGAGPWPERTGLPALDSRAWPTTVRHVLALASTDLGYNYAIVVRVGELS